MARIRRRTRGSSKADWVFRGLVYDQEGTPISFVHPTYQEEYLAIAANQSVVMWLYDSRNTMANFIGEPSNQIASAARAEGRKVVIKGIDVLCHLTVTNWVTNARIRMGMRIGVFEQDPLDGDAILDANYDMWRSFGPIDQPANWANALRQNIREYRFFKEAVPDQTAREMIVRDRLRFRTPIVLDSNEGLGMYWQTDNFSSTVNVARWCRTLVVDEQ